MHSPDFFENLIIAFRWHIRRAYWAVRGRRPILTGSAKAWRRKLYQSIEEEARNQCPLL